MNYVYLIEGKNGVVKIGTSYNPKSRDLTVRTHSPIPTRLIAYWEGSLSEERQLHDAFKKYRSHGEWFFIEGALVAFVESKRGFGLEGIPEWPVEGALRSFTHSELVSKRRSDAHKARWATPGYREERLAYNAAMKKRRAEIKAQNELRPDIWEAA